MSVTEDPWASTTTPEPEQPVAQAPASVSNPVSADAVSGLEISITVKGSGGFDEPWVVLRGTPAEVHAFTGTAQYKEILDRTYSQIGPAYKGAGTTNTGNSGGNTQQRQSAPRGAQEPPPGTAPAPGPGWVYRTGKKKNGQGTWEAWMPPQGSDEKPVWL